MSKIRKRIAVALIASANALYRLAERINPCPPNVEQGPRYPVANCEIVTLPKRTTFTRKRRAGK